jgi:hypothetical protein
VSRVRSPDGPPEQEAVALRQPLFEFEVESLMFDVDVFKFKAFLYKLQTPYYKLKKQGLRMMTEAFVRSPCLVVHC